MRKQKTSKRWVLIGFLILISLGIYGLWIINLAGGSFENGLFTYSLEGNIPIFHVIAEFLTATVTLVGAAGLWREASWGRGVTLVGLGMFAYAAINSMGWAIHNDITQAIPMALTLVVIAAALPYLLKNDDKPINQ